MVVACEASVSIWFRGKERPVLAALLPAPFFARCLILVPRSLLLNRTETLATQANMVVTSRCLLFALITQARI